MSAITTRAYASYEQAAADRSLPEGVREAILGSWPTTEDGHRIEAEDVVFAEVEVDAGCEQAYGESRVTLVQPVLVGEVVAVCSGLALWGTVSFAVNGSTRGEVLRNRPAFMADRPAYGWRLAR